MCKIWLIIPTSSFDCISPVSVTAVTWHRKLFDFGTVELDTDYALAQNFFNGCHISLLPIHASMIMNATSASIIKMNENNIANKSLFAIDARNSTKAALMQKILQNSNALIS